MGLLMDEIKPQEVVDCIGDLVGNIVIPADEIRKRLDQVIERKYNGSTNPDLQRRILVMAMEYLGRFGYTSPVPFLGQPSYILTIPPED